MSIPIIRPNTCATCSYKVGAGTELYCRFNPPAVTVLMGMTKNGPAPTGQMVTFPKVEPHWWCGQFKAGLTRTDEVDKVPAVMTAQ